MGEYSPIYFYQYKKGLIMPLLKIDFSAGFDKTKVEIDIDHKKVTDMILTTDYSAGFADSYKLNMKSTKTVLSIKIPKLNLQKNMELKMLEDTYLLVNLTPEKELEISSTNKNVIYF